MNINVGINNPTNGLLHTSLKNTIWAREIIKSSLFRQYMNDDLVCISKIKFNDRAFNVDI